jgi:hypothetical protein
MYDTYHLAEDKEFKIDMFNDSINTCQIIRLAIMICYFLMPKDIRMKKLGDIYTRCIRRIVF